MSKFHKQDTYVFVYGTLKKDEKYNYLLDNSTFIGTGKTKNLMSMKEHPEYKFPCLFEKPISHIYGEIYSVDSSIIKDLDKLEEVPTLYMRVPIPILFQNSEIICESFIFNSEFKAKLITDWFTF